MELKLIKNAKATRASIKPDGSAVRFPIENDDGESVTLEFTYLEFQEFCRAVAITSSQMDDRQTSGYTIPMSTRIQAVAVAPESTTESVFLSLRQEDTQTLHNFSMPTPTAAILCEQILNALGELKKSGPSSKH